jgi:hypothetical protein
MLCYEVNRFESLKPQISYQLGISEVLKHVDLTHQITADSHMMGKFFQQMGRQPI